MQVLLSRLSFFKAKDISNSFGSGLQSYRKTAEAVMCGLLPDSPTATKSRTDSNVLLECCATRYSYLLSSSLLVSLPHLLFHILLIKYCLSAWCMSVLSWGSEGGQMYVTLLLMSREAVSMIRNHYGLCQKKNHYGYKGAQNRCTEPLGNLRF